MKFRFCLLLTKSETTGGDEVYDALPKSKWCKSGMNFIFLKERGGQGCDFEWFFPGIARSE